VSGRRILTALSEGESDPEKLAQLGSERLKCSQEELADALTGKLNDAQKTLLTLHLERLKLLDKQILQLSQLCAQSMKKYDQAVKRLAQVPGFGVESAQQFIAEVGSGCGGIRHTRGFRVMDWGVPGKPEKRRAKSKLTQPERKPVRTAAVDGSSPRERFVSKVAFSRNCSTDSL
jgi:transposase